MVVWTVRWRQYKSRLGVPSTRRRERRGVCVRERERVRRLEQDLFTKPPILYTATSHLLCSVRHSHGQSIHYSPRHMHRCGAAHTFHRCALVTIFPEDQTVYNAPSDFNAYSERYSTRRSRTRVCVRMMCSAHRHKWRTTTDL